MEGKAERGMKKKTPMFKPGQVGIFLKVRENRHRQLGHAQYKSIRVILWSNKLLATWVKFP